MKIYFEDGELFRPNSIDFTYHYIVDARYGYTKNISLLNHIKDFDSDGIVYTNSIIALNNHYAWNNEMNVPDIYIIKEDEFIRIDKLTNKALRKAHNIMKMYIAGAFNN